MPSPATFVLGSFESTEDLGAGDMVEYGIAAGSKGSSGSVIPDWASSLANDPTNLLIAGAVAVVVMLMIIR